MFEFMNGFLKNITCLNCTENEFESNYIKENYKDWNLYLKEYELYSAMIMFNEKIEKDISYLINKNDSILLYNENNEIFIKLEYISKNETDQLSILVPTDEYQILYESIENMEKKFDKKRNAYYIGTYNIKKCK